MIEELLKKYEPENYKLIKKPLIKEEIREPKDYVGCSGKYPNRYGIDEEYWNYVINADELE